jgi:hypothetical protein
MLQRKNIIFCGFLLVYLVGSGCTDTAKQTAQNTPQTEATTVIPASQGQDNSSVANTNSAAVSNTLKIYDATVVLALTQQFPEKFCDKFPVQDLVRTLYTTHLKPDDTSTLTISGMLVEPIGTEPQTYLAVVKTAHSSDACTIDVFTFREGNEQPVIAHLSYNPDFDEIDLKSVQNKKYRITDTEFAIAFEWNGYQTDAQRNQRTTMLSLFRVQNGIMQPIFELCTSNTAQNNAVSSDEYETLTEDKASMETVNTWGKELYSILVTRTVSRKSTIETGSRNETKRTKTLYQWDGERYVETNQLL